jgi:GT2 family glycosyltransferase
VVVVDNDADTAVAAALAGLSPDVIYLAAPGNAGFAAGLALGIDRLRGSHNLEWFWLLDDDSPPAATALAAALQVAGSTRDTQSAGVGAVANRGGHIVAGRIRHDLGRVVGSVAQRADFTLVDGTIISAAAVADVGLPRADLFSMLEDVEYTTRIRVAGYTLLVRPADESEFLHMGSQAEWRNYYQARNHLRVAIDLRQWSWVWGWFVRETGIGLHLVYRRRFGALRLRWRGALDAVRNRMGKVVEPV